jgi:tripartite-type tricarboxylate transporter receptor subunit TctC
MAFLSISNVLGLADQANVKILAVLEPRRFALRPQIPSMSEVLPAFRKPSSWFGLFGPAGLPAPITARLNTETSKALNAPDILPKLNDNGLAVIAGTPEEFKALIEDGIVRYGAIIQAAGIQPE